MDIYYVEVSGIPKECVHAGLRKFEQYSNIETYDLFLTTNGRLTDSLTKRVNLNDEYLAMEFIEYWRPRLIARQYGNIRIELKTETANAWQEKGVYKHKEKVESLLKNDAHKNISKKRVPINNGNIVIRVTHKDNEEKEQKGFVRGLTNAGIVTITPALHNARRYKSESHCEKILSRLSDGYDFRPSMLFLSSDEIEDVIEEKSIEQDFVFYRI